MFSDRDVYVERRQHKKKEKRNSNWDVIYDLNFRCGSLNLHRQVGECVGGAAPHVFQLCLRVPRRLPQNDVVAFADFPDAVSRW